MKLRVTFSLIRIFILCFILGMALGSIAEAGTLTATYDCPYISKPLVQGDKGFEVFKLQVFLMTEGIDIPAGATAYYGAQTKVAVSEFQLKYSFQILYPLKLTKPTGAVYSATIKQINLIQCY